MSSKNTQNHCFTSAHTNCYVISDETRAMTNRNDASNRERALPIEDIVQPPQDQKDNKNISTKENTTDDVTKTTTDDDVTYSTIDVPHIDDISRASLPPDIISEIAHSLPAGRNQGDVTRSSSHGRHTNDVGKAHYVSKDKVLPPCRVCGNEASGFHYGCNTCEACKGFFRRALVRSGSFRCKGTGRCTIKGGNRSLCAFCRFQRCLSLGMCKKAIKTGRYTHEKRTRDTLEVRELEPFLESDECRTAKMSEEVDVIAQVTHAARQPAFLSTSHRSLQDIICLRLSSKNKVLRSGEPSFEHSTLNIEQSQQGDLGLFQSQLNAMDLTKRLNTPGLPREIRHPVSGAQRLLNHCIHFGCSVPGFATLCAEDQTTLCRSAWVEVALLGSGVYDDSFLNVSITTSQKLSTNNHDSNEFLAKLSCAMRRLRRLTLTSQELALTQALCLTFPDRGDLVNKVEVESVHWLVVGCLLNTLRNNHGSLAGLKFSEIISMVTGLRDISHEMDDLQAWELKKVKKAENV